MRIKTLARTFEGEILLLLDEVIDKTSEDVDQIINSVREQFGVIGTLASPHSISETTGRDRVMGLIVSPAVRSTLKTEFIFLCSELHIDNRSVLAAISQISPELSLDLELIDELNTIILSLQSTVDQFYAEFCSGDNVLTGSKSFMRTRFKILKSKLKTIRKRASSNVLILKIDQLIFTLNIKGVRFAADPISKTLWSPKSPKNKIHCISLQTKELQAIIK